MRNDIERHLPAPTIPWSLAEEIYKVYVELFGDSQSLEEIARRGGFAYGEIYELMKVRARVAHLPPHRLPVREETTHEQIPQKSDGTEVSATHGSKMVTIRKMLARFSLARKVHSRARKVVRYFRHPDISGESKCVLCRLTMHVHGWIDGSRNSGTAHTVCPGDWILTMPDGTFAPCDPEEFAVAYEPIEAASAAG